MAKKKKAKKKKAKKKKIDSDFYSELKSDGYKFQDLVSAYFRAGSKSVARAKEIITITTNTTGIGADNGKDILVTINLQDSVTQFERKWVVQCKFHKKNISPKDLWGVDIPSLISANGADGYLLVCRKYPTEATKTLFENLRLNTRYDYEIWTGPEFFQERLVNYLEEVVKLHLPNLYSKQVGKENKQE